MNRQTFDEQFNKFVEQSQDGRFQPVASEQNPVLDEDTEKHGGWCFVYALHTGWAARILMETRPERHVDMSSSVYFAATASAIVKSFELYDFREVFLPLPGLTTGKADLTKLPFGDGSISSLSSMHVLEHIGMGRYGDPIDAQGDLKAAAELCRVLAPGGQLLMVLPINRTPKAIFNAHRWYSYEQILSMFPGLTVKEFTLIGADRITRNADPNRIRDVKANEYEDCACIHFIKS